MPGGSVTPAPVGVEPVPDGDGDGVAFFLTRTWPEAEVGALACGEVPLAVRVMRVPAVSFLGTATLACSSTGWAAASPTVQVALPGAWQTVKAGHSLPGLAAMRTVAVPCLFPANQTQIAKRARPPGRTPVLPASA